MTVKELYEQCKNSICDQCKYYDHCGNLNRFMTGDYESNIVPVFIKPDMINILDDTIYFDEKGEVRKYEKRD